MQSTASTLGEEGPTGPRQTLPLKCSFCGRHFTRTEHLKRHLRLHTGEKNFRCPCGTTYSRSDALARHTKGCEAARNTQHETSVGERAKRTRVKRACDRCAKLKVKCDYENPCQRCTQKQLSCSTTPDRQAGEQQEDPGAGLAVPTTVQSPVDHGVYHLADLAMPVHNSHQSVDTGTSFRTELGHLHDTNDFGSHFPGRAAIWNLWTGDSLDSGSESFLQPSHPEDQDFGVGLPSFDLIGFSLNPFLGSFPDVELGPFQSGPSIPTPPTLSNESLRSSIPKSFCLDQIDPVEARCCELKSIIKDFQPIVPEEVITRCMNRRSLVRAIDLCGKHYQSNHPILHSPTFSLSKCDPILLLAMFCVGALYAQDMVSARDVFKIATGILTMIESLPHERNMEEPQLSTIQASIAACCVLACSNDEAGAKYASIYIARSISMARRAKVFDTLEQVDYGDMIAPSFDWLKWIERETRKRIACALFAQDVASCIFQGAAPSFSPLKLDIELPCYESCWTADSAEKCLQELQRTPLQPRLAQTLQTIQNLSSYENQSIFEVSAFGMFILIKGLHCVVWYATNYDFNQHSNDVGYPAPPFTKRNLLNQLDQGLSGPAVAKLADNMETLNSSSTIGNVNQSLNHWQKVWSLRKFHEEDHENPGFALDPLPFWWLAKALLMLHCSSTAPTSHSRILVSEGDGDNIHGKMLSQARVFRWLVNFRSQCRKQPQVMRSTNGDSMVDLMQPISDEQAEGED